MSKDAGAFAPRDDGRPHPEIATLLRQKPAAEGRIQGIGRHNATKAALDALRNRMEALRRSFGFARSRARVRDHRACG
jgi:hypothetical protein